MSNPAGGGGGGDDGGDGGGATAVVSARSEPVLANPGDVPGADSAVAQLVPVNPEDVPDPVNPEVQPEKAGKSECKLRYPNLNKIEAGDVPKCDIEKQPEGTPDRKYVLVFTVRRPREGLPDKLVYSHRTREIPISNEIVIEKEDMKWEMKVFKVKLKKIFQKNQYFTLRPYFLPPTPPI